MELNLLAYRYTCSEAIHEVHFGIQNTGRRKFITLPNIYAALSLFSFEMKDMLMC